MAKKIFLIKELRLFRHVPKYEKREPLENEKKKNEYFQFELRVHTFGVDI